MLVAMRIGALILASLVAALPPGRASGAEAAGPDREQPSPASSGPAQTAVFKVFVRGHQIGTEQATVALVDGEWVITATSTLGAPVALSLRRAEIRYTADWRPLSIEVEGDLRGQAIDLETTFSEGTATSHFMRDGQRQEQIDPVSAGAVALPGDVYAAYTALAVRLSSVRPGDEVRAYVAPRGEVGITLTEVASERMQTASRTFDLKRYRVVLQDANRGLPADVWAEPDGRLVRFSIPSAFVDVVREDVASVSARQQQVHREGDEDVRVPGHGFSLAATMSKPAPSGVDRSRAAVRLPAVVLVGGSGATDRDEAVAGIPIFGQMASALAEAGFLVIRYDKRGTGQSGGRPESATLNDYAEDVRGVVRYLATRKDVDPKRITVAGHGEGAWVALVAASREKRIARLVLMAGAGTTGAELVLEQQRRQLDRSGLPEADRRERVELQKRIHQAVVSGGPWDGIPEALRAQADTPWFASFLAFDPKTAMPRVSQPLLIVHGEEDRQVPAHHASALAALASARKNAPGVEVARIPGVDHLLVPAKSGDAGEHAPLQGREVSRAVTDALAAWLAR
jgi:pimeloyl-ACP methyl ester carboxylesterase